MLLHGRHLAPLMEDLHNAVNVALFQQPSPLLVGSLSGQQHVYREACPISECSVVP
jgi:hypothetical protein